MRFWSRWREQRRARKRDRQAFEAMMALAPTREQEAVASERLAEVTAMAQHHDAERVRRAELVASADWDDE